VKYVTEDAQNGKISLKEIEGAKEKAKAPLERIVGLMNDNLPKGRWGALRGQFIERDDIIDRPAKKDDHL
jgi:hypothetical protein